MVLSNLKVHVRYPGTGHIQRYGEPSVVQYIAEAGALVNIMIPNFMQYRISENQLRSHALSMLLIIQFVSG